MLVPKGVDTHSESGVLSRVNSVPWTPKYLPGVMTGVMSMAMLEGAMGLTYTTSEGLVGVGDGVGPLVYVGVGE